MALTKKTLLGKELIFTEEMDLFNSLRRKYLLLSTEAAEKAKEEFLTKITGYEEYRSYGQGIMDEIFERYLQIGVRDIISYGIYDIDEVVLCEEFEKDYGCAFRTQLRALLRASVYGDLRIMFPMIATLQEFRKAKGILMEEKEKLVAEDVKVSDTIQVGIMIEIPAAAVLADQFAKEVDFFSIGTNDLIQYTFAADRMSSGVSYLYQPYNPSILRLLKHVIDSAHKEGKWAGMCGEMAGEQMAAPLLLGLGLDEFSMSATSVLAQRKLIRNLSKADMEELANKALNCGTMEEVVALVKEVVE